MAITLINNKVIAQQAVGGFSDLIVGKDGYLLVENAAAVRLDGNGAEVVIRDEGSGFNKDELAHAANPEDPLAHLDVREKLGLREGGFGLMITRGMVDEVRHNEVGNEVTLIKRFAPDGGDDPTAPDNGLHS